MNLCRLCKSRSDLQGSHIIPSSFYKEMEDDNGIRSRYERLSRIESPQKEQGGIKELLLCSICEGHLSKYETYSIPILKIIKQNNKLENYTVDYKKFKLFALSILFRSPLATDPFFNEINLGHHEIIIRDMLINDDPGDIYTYPFIIGRITNNNGILSFNAIAKPTKSKFDNHTIYRFIFGGFMWLFFVSSHTKSRLILDLSIQQNGALPIHKADLSKMKKVIDGFSRLKFQ